MSMSSYYFENEDFPTFTTSEAVNDSAVAGHVSLDPPVDTWKTKDGLIVPLARLGDRHLLNILNMLKRQAVVRNAARTVALLRADPRGDGARMAVDFEIDQQIKTTWRDATPEIWRALMVQARSRPAVANQAAELEDDDQRKEQLAIELASMTKTKGTK